MIRIKHSWIVIIVISIVAISLLITLFSQQAPLPGYVENSTSEPEETTQKQAEMFSYTEATTGFTIQIPVNWQRVNKGSSVEFIHKGTASSIKISEQEYNPSILSLTKSSSSTAITAAGYEFIDFYWDTNSRYVLTYKKNDKSVQTLYIEITDFDRDNIVKTTYTINAEYYDEMKSLIEQSIDSIVWNKKNPIPQEFVLQYFSFGNFEFGSPIGWTSSINNGAYYAQNNDTGAFMVITAANSNISYENIDQIDYITLASQGRNNFALSTFSVDRNIIRGTAVYMQDQQQYMMMQYMIATGEYEYTITFECPTSVYEQTQQLYEQAIKLFRIF